MQVCLVAPLHASKTRGFGVERYAFEIQEGLAKRGMPARTVSSTSLLESYESSRIVRMVGVAYEGLQLIASTSRQRIIHFAEPVLGLTSLVIPRISPVVTTVHEVPDVLSHGSNLGKGITVIRLATSRSDLIIADSTSTKSDLVQKMEIAPDKITVVNLGIDERFRPGLGIRTSGKKAIGYVGAISKKKNLEVLLEAFSTMRSKHPQIDASLEIWGPFGEYATRLAERTSSLGLKDVHFRGFADERDLPSIYNSFDAFVFPSLKEGFGFPILEAQRCGVPTILLERANIPPEVSAKSILVAGAPEMAEKIHDIITDPDYAGSISRDALEYSKRFAWENTVSETIQVYRRLGLSEPAHAAL